jgi:uncharacterized protein (DUF58 family)
VISEDLLNKVRLLEIRSRRAVNEVFAGEYASAFRGKGMEFSEVRAYQPGDDVRAIDWNVTARTGEPFVKRYVEERELTVMFVCDLSASGDFGSVRRVKNETAAELCAVLAFAATRNNDKTGLVIFTDRVERFVPPKKGKNHALRVVRELLEFEPGAPDGLDVSSSAGRRGRRRNSRETHHPGTDPAAALERLAIVLRRKAVIVFVSDFLFEAEQTGERTSGPGGNGAQHDRTTPTEERFDTALRILARRHDVITAHVADPRELELPRAGMIELADAETGARRLVDTSSGRVRRRFAELARRHAQHVRERSQRAGVDHVFLRTDRPYIHDLIELFHRRERRR